MTSFWSGWIIVLTVISLILVTWLLIANKSGKAGQTTGHIYDGIEEYDNPLPMWWFYMYIITVIFAIGYLIAYPGMGNFKGVLDWTQVNQYESRIAEAEARYGPLFAQHAATPIEELAGDDKAMKMSQRIFANNCAQCHGSDAAGGFGFPNLTDDNWLYGGSAEQIKASITHGRNGVMPGWKDALGEQGLINVTAYVQSLNGRPVDEVLATKGAAQFATFCVACHSQDGKGNQMMGAPDLTNNNWLYGGSPTQIKFTIANGRGGKMPPHRELLSENKIHLLSAYVYGLSHK
ncbi:MAG: cytochrome-c oxidase, cbb3-type subunit III [Pseudomonadales bacterium]